MAKTKPSRPHVTGPLAQYVEGFRSELTRLDYTPLTAAGHLRLMAHLSRWLADRNLGPSALDEMTVNAYFVQRRAAGYTNERTERSLRPLLEHLRQQGGVPVPTPPEPATPVDGLLAEYRKWMRLERGLSDGTVELNVRLVRLFLVSYVVGSDSVEVGSLTAKDVADFVMSRARQRPRSVKRRCARCCGSCTWKAISPTLWRLRYLACQAGPLLACGVRKRIRLWVGP